LIRLAVRCSPEQAEFVLAELAVLSPGGVEQVDREDQVEFAIYGAEGELPEVGEIEASLGDSRVTLTSSVVGDDWEERWKAFHRPDVVASASGESSVWVGPPWADRPERDSLLIDPGMAFGTGAHPTTRLSLGFLLDLAEAGSATGSLLDLGSGAGALAIAGAMLGFDPVIAADSEPAAVTATSANAELNRVSPSVVRLDLRTDPIPASRTVVANLTGPLLGVLAERLEGGNLPATVACSGFLASEREKVGDRFRSLGYEVTASTGTEGWAGLLLAA
jgi:ribosomal protein L11 methyltransferase